MNIAASAATVAYPTATGAIVWGLGGLLLSWGINSFTSEHVDAREWAKYGAMIGGAVGGLQGLSAAMTTTQYAGVSELKAEALAKVESAPPWLLGLTGAVVGGVVVSKVLG